MADQKREWYERLRPLCFRVWNGNEFTDECSVVMGKNGAEVMGLGIQPGEAIIQLGTGCQDSADHEIFEGDYLMTDEGNWVTVVVYDDNHGHFMCEDKLGGFSGCVNWGNCLVVGNVFEGIDKELVRREAERRESAER